MYAIYCTLIKLSTAQLNVKRVLNYIDTFYKHNQFLEYLLVNIFC